LEEVNRLYKTRLMMLIGWACLLAVYAVLIQPVVPWEGWT